MPIAIKSVVIVERHGSRPTGVRYVWMDIGVGLMALATRLLGFGQGPVIDQAFQEVMGLVTYRYDPFSIQDHSIQPRIRSLLQPAAWLISVLLGMTIAGVYMACRALVGFAPTGRMIPEDLLESALIGMLFFVLSLGVRLWMSVRADIMEQVIQERGDVHEGVSIKYIPLTEWPAFLVNSEATTISPSAKSPDSIL